MPNEPKSLDQIERDYLAKVGKATRTSRDIILESQVRSDVIYGTPEERAERLRNQAALAAIPKIDLKSALGELFDLPGALLEPADPNLKYDIKRRRLGAKYIKDNLADQIKFLKEDGLTDDNLQTYNNIWKEIDGYGKRAINYQKNLDVEIDNTNRTISYDPFGFSQPGIYKKQADLYDKVVKKDDVNAIVGGIQKELNDIKAPYLGKKFLRDVVGVNFGEEAVPTAYASKFNNLFNKDASWQSDDQLLKAMKKFAYENANPGDQLYSLRPEDVDRIINGKDLSESERVTSKLLEDITLNGLATAFVDESKRAAAEGNQEAIDTFKTSLDNINQRALNSKKIYNISDYNKLERTGAQLFMQSYRGLRSLVSKVTPFYEYEPDAAHLGNDIRFGGVPVDLNNDGTIDTDKYGNVILSNQFTYIKKDGSMGANIGAIPELSAAVIGQMAPIIAIDALTRGVGGKLAGLAVAGEAAGALGVAARTAQTLGKTYEAVNAWRGLRLADRISTFGLVTGSVYDNMYADELRWTKDRDSAASRAWGRSIIEGLTEAIGAPEVGMLSANRFTTPAKAGLLRMFSPQGSTISAKLTNFITNSKTVGKLALGQAITESLEEEMSLYGNYLYGKMLKAQDEGYKKEDEFEAKDIVQTFLDSFVSMAPYSLLGVGIQQAKARKSVGVEHQVLWDMANNPEYYKAQIKDLLDKKKFTPEQAARAVQTVNETKGVLDSIPEWENLKDLRTLLSDKEAQMKYFHDKLYRDKLQTINYDELTDEQKDALKNARLLTQVKESAQKQLDELAKKQTLTPEEEELKGVLKNLAAKVSLSTHQFTAAEKKSLVDLKVLKEDDLTNSKEDLLKELETVDKSILKTKEKVDQFVNMSDQEKESIITKLFNEQIASVAETNDPKVLSSQLAKTKQQLEFINTFPTKYASEQTGRANLIEAIETKLGEQIAINPETGRNLFTDNLLEEDLSETSFIELTRKRQALDRNKEFVNQEDYNELSKRYVEIQNKQVQGFNELSPEKQVEFLTTFLKDSTKISPDFIFELDTLKDALSLKIPVYDSEGKIIKYDTVFTPNITEELFTAAREKAFPELAKEKKEQITAEEEKVSEEVDTSAFTEQEEKALSTRDVVDETGKSQTNYTEQVFNWLNQTEKGNATLSKEYFANKLIGKTDSLLKSKGITLPQFKRLAQYLKNTVLGNYTPQRIAAEGREILASMPKEIQDTMKGIIDVAKFANKFYQVNKKRRTIKGKIERPKKETGKEVIKEASEEVPEFSEEFSEEEVTEDSLLRQATADSVLQEKELTEKQNAVIQLQMPSSTYGFEVTRSNKLSEDPAIQRNAEILRFLTTQDYSTLKVRVTSRSNFLKQLAEAQGVSYDEFIQLLNKAHEEYKTVKGSAQQKAKAIFPILQELNNFFGEDFFEQTFDETRGVPELIYMVEKNGTNLSDPILTVVSSEGNIQSFNGYPFYTNIDSSPKILTSQESQQLPYWENILGSRVSELQQFKPIADAVVGLASKIKSNPTYSQDFPISRITQGTYITETEQLVPLEKSGLEINEEDVKVIKTPKQTIGTEVIAGVPGQAFVVVNGVTSVLLNDKVDPLEAEALAMMVFDKSLREQFFPGNDAAEEAQKLKDHIAKILNIYEKQGRKLAFVYDEKSQNLIPFIPGVSGKQLTQEELTKLLQQMFYNVKEKALDTMVPRFSLKDGEVIQTAKQSYLDFVKSTHKIYMSGNQPAVRRNQRIIFDMAIKTTPVTKAPAPKKEAPKKEEEPTMLDKAFEALGKKKTEEAAKEATEKEEPAETKAQIEFEGAAKGLKEAILANVEKVELIQETLEDGTIDSYYLINGERYERVSTEIPFTGDKASFATKRALSTGSLVDGILRDVFAGRTPEKPGNISTAAFNNVVKQAKQIYQTVAKDYVVITEQMTVWDEQAKVAGTIDMVLIDKKTGEAYIVDFKTSQWIDQIKGKIMGYNSETRDMSISIADNPKADYVTQQNSYGLMFFQQYGVAPELNIMYIRIGYENKTSENVTEVSILTDSGMPIITIPTDKTKVIPSLQPTEKAKPVTKPVAKEAPAKKKLIAKTPAEAPVSTDARAQGTNARGTTYKGETTEKDGLKVTKYSEFFPDGKRISKGGRIMTPAKFIEEYNITDQDYLDSLEGATEIRIYEVREGKDTTDISIQATFPEGNIDMEVASASTSISTDAKADIEAAYSYITTRKYQGDRRGQVNKVGEDLANRFVATLKEKGLVKEGYRMAPRTDGSVERMKVNTDAEGNNLGNDWSTAGKFKEEFRKFVDAELDALEAKPETKEEPTDETKEEGYSPFAAGLTVDQLRKGKENKNECGTVGVKKNKKEL